MKFFRLNLLFGFLFVLFSNFSSSVNNPKKVVDSDEISSINGTQESRKFHLAYVVSQHSNEMIPVDLETGVAGTPILLEHHPDAVFIAPDACTAYSFQKGSNEIVSVDLRTGKNISSIFLEMDPSNLVIDTDGKTAYVTSERSNLISKVELGTGTVHALMTLDGVPSQIAMTPDGKTLYVSYEGWNEVTPIDIESLSKQPSLVLQDVPQAIAITPDNKMTCIGEYASKTITFYDLKTGEVSGEVLIKGEADFLGKKIQRIHLSLDGERAYLTQENSHAIISVDLTTQVVDAPINMNHNIKNIALYPKQKLVASFSEKIAPVGQESSFDASKTSPFKGEIIDYLWDFGDGHEVSSTSPCITHTYQSADRFDVTLTVREDLAGFSIDETPSLSAVATASIKVPKASGKYAKSSKKHPRGHVQTVSGGPNPSTTTIGSSANPAVFGQSITFSSSVTGGFGTPTGTVDFFDGVTLLGSGTLDGSGNTTFVTSALAVGSHSISATYNGDVTYASSSSSPLVQQINKAQTSTAVVGVPNPSIFGNSVTFTATISVTAPGAGTPTGTVTFKDGAATIGTGTIVGNQAVLVTSSLTTGSHNITAVYNGDGNFLTSTSPNFVQTVNKGSTSTSVGTSLTPSPYGNTVTFTATVVVTTGAGTPTGTVTFKDGVTTIGTSAVNLSGIATLAINTLSVATHSITAVYNGDANFLTSTSPSISQVITQATPTDVVTSSLSPSTFGDMVIFTATVSAPTTVGLPSGTVDFYDGLTLMGTGTLNPIGPNTASTTFTTSALDAGTHSITGQYSGDGNFIAVTSPIFSQVVNPVSSTTTVVFSNSPNPSEFGQTVVLRATVTGLVATPPQHPTGSITFFDGVTPIGTVAVSPVSGIPNASTTSLSVSNFTVGSHAITAQYLGDTNYPASPVSAPMTQVVILGDTTSVVVTSGTPSVFGQNVTFTVTVSSTVPGMGAPTGTVAFYDKSTFLGNSSPLIPGVNSSTATFSIATLSPGSHKIFGFYTGSTNFKSSSAPRVIQIVNQDSTSTLITGSSSSPPGFDFGDFITFTATVTANAPGSGTPTGTVQFFDGATLIATGTLSGGVATGTTVKLYPTPPSHSITAVYSGDINYIASTSPIFLQNISGTLPTTTTVTSSRNSSPVSQAVTYSARVVANPGPGQGIPGIPAGTVTFTDVTQSIVLGTATLNANGIATITESGANLGVIGTYQIQAVYNGQAAVFDPSTSALFNQYIVPFDTTTTLVAMPNPSTQSGSNLVATVNVVGGGFPTDGELVFFYQNGTLLGSAPISSGVATFMPGNLHFGSSTIIAVYSGDTTQYATSTSNPVTLQVQQTDMLTTTTTISSSLISSISCQPVTFTAVVVETQGFYTPTGTVTFFDNGVEFGTAILDGTGTAHLTTSDLSIGTHAITATYNSDSNYAFSFSNTFVQTVSANTTLTTFSILPSLPSTPYGENLVFTAIVTSTSPYAVTPTGAVTFSYGDVTLATVPLDENGIAIYEIATLDVGTYTFSATYNLDICSDPCFDPCFVTSTASQSHTITRIYPITLLSSTPNPSTYGDRITLNGTVSSPSGTPTGTVTFYEGVTFLGTEPLVEGLASIDFASPLAGITLLNGQYSGDINFLPVNISSILQNVNKAPTSTCLVSYTDNPSVYGEPVSLNATVSSLVSDITPGITGTVTFKNGATVLGIVTLTGCDTAQLQTSSLNLGSSNNITATYSGDANFATSVSSTLNLTVNQAATNTTVTSITSAPNPPTFGTNVTFNVAVTPQAPGTGTPTGTVTGFYGSTSLGVATLSGGVASFSTSVLPVGVQTIIVKYSGDTNFSASQTVATETVLGVATSTAISSTANPSVSGQPVTFNVTVTSAGGTPTGTVAFLDGTTTLATETLNSSGAASFTISTLSVGSHSIRAIYSGSANLLSSTSSTITQVVNQASTTTIVSSILNPSVYGESVTLNALVSANSPGSGIPTGTVIFKNGVTPISGSVALNSNGVAVFTLPSLPVGTDPITAVYSGSTNFTTSISSPLSQSVTITPTITSVTSATNPVAFGNTVSISGTVSPLNNGSTTLPSGSTVTAFYGSTAVGSGTLNGSGQYTFLLSGLPAGTLAIEVKYPGDANFAPSTITLTQTVTLDTSTISIAPSVNPSSFGQPVTITNTVTLGSGQTPTGTVSYYDGSTLIGTTAVGTPLVISTLSPGTHQINAVYSGSANAASATSNTVSQVVNQSSTTTTVVSNLNPSIYGDNVTFTATVTHPGSGVPTGFVTFKNGATVLGTGDLDSAGNASFSIATLPVGSNPITAVYSGDTNFATSTSAPLTQVVTKLSGSATTVTIVSSAPNPSVFGQNVNFFANVASASGIPTGTVTYFDGVTPLSTVPIYDGFAILSITSLSPGNHNITAVYNGDSNFDPSLPSNIYLQMVNPVAITITTVTTLTSSLNPSTFGDPVTFDVQVTSVNTPPDYPTGFVTLYTGSTPLITLPLDPLAHASYLTSALPVGNLQIVALYSGDSNFSSSTDVISQVVNPIVTTTTLVSSLNPSNFGDPVTFTATVSTGGGPIPTGSVSFYDGPELIETILLSNTGVADFVTSSLSPGSHGITAVYNADPSFATSNDSLTQLVDPGATTTTVFSSSANPSNLGESVTFIANTSAINGTPTGLVTFYDGATPLGTSPLFGGLAFFSTATLPVGAHSITASYAGNADYDPSTSSAFIQQVINQSTILQPPRSFCACPLVSKFLNTIYHANVLTWVAPGTGAEPKFYKLYRNPELTCCIATIPACGPLMYTDPRCSKEKTYTYYLVAGNESGVSSPVSVTIGPHHRNCCSREDIDDGRD